VRGFEKFCGAIYSCLESSRLVGFGDSEQGEGEEKLEVEEYTGDTDEEVEEDADEEDFLLRGPGVT
jgi:hypothetical protein